MEGTRPNACSYGGHPAPYGGQVPSIIIGIIGIVPSIIIYYRRYAFPDGIYYIVLYSYNNALIINHRKEK